MMAHQRELAAALKILFEKFKSIRGSQRRCRRRGWSKNESDYVAAAADEAEPKDIEEEVVGEAIEEEPKATEDAGVEKEGPKTVGARIHGREALCIQSSRTRWSCGCIG